MKEEFIGKSFNSIKVRLKALVFQNIKRQKKEFQFHKGAIKRRVTTACGAFLHLFQFHKGAIKRDLQPVTSLFHSSFISIKVRLKAES